MIRLKHKNTKRIITATCLLLLFTFTSLYATYQNGQDFNAAYADSSSNNVADCVFWVGACTAAGLAATAACISFNPTCPGLVIAAAAACSEAEKACS